MSDLLPAIVCLGAGPSQALVIDTAKSLGFYVIAVDHDVNTIRYRQADEYLVLSTYEAEPIIRELRKLQIHFDIQGVINRSSGPPSVTASFISQALELPGILPQAAEIIINKAFLVSACNKFDISAPKHQSVCSLNEVDWNHYPAVIKPGISLVGKRSVYRVENETELHFRFAEAQTSAYDGVVEIEEYISGQDVVLVSMVSQGVLLPVVLLDEINEFNEDGELQGKGFAVPSTLSGSAEELETYCLANQIIAKFGLDTTPLFVNCRCPVGEVPKVIEVHLDLAGDLILDELLPTANPDFDFMTFAIRTMTGQRLPIPRITFSPFRTVVEGDSYRMEPYT